MKPARSFKTCGTQTIPVQAWNNKEKQAGEIQKILFKQSLFPIDVKRSEAQHQPVSWTDFFGLSTCAAIVHLGNFHRQPLLIRLIWIVTLITGVTFTAWSSYNSAVSFLRVSARSEMLIEKVPGNRLEFPKLHICTTNTFNVSILKGVDTNLKFCES